MAEELKEREAFELQAAMRGLDISMFTPPSEKEYRNPDTQAEWQGWKARAQLPSQWGDAVAWHTDDHLTDKSATTYDREVAERWRAKGWPVTMLYTHPADQVAEPDAELVALLRESLKDVEFSISEGYEDSADLKKRIDAALSAKP